MLSNHINAFVQGKPHHLFKIMTCFQYIMPKVNQEVQEGQGEAVNPLRIRCQEKLFIHLWIKTISHVLNPTPCIICFVIHLWAL